MYIRHPIVTYKHFQSPWGIFSLSYVRLHVTVLKLSYPFSSHGTSVHILVSTSIILFTFL